MRKLLVVSILSLLSATSKDDESKIIRPLDRSVGKISIAAKDPDARLELDGQHIPTQEPFPDVFQAIISPTPGLHSSFINTPYWQGTNYSRWPLGVGPPSTRLCMNFRKRITS